MNARVMKVRLCRFRLIAAGLLLIFAAAMAVRAAVTPLRLRRFRPLFPKLANCTFYSNQAGADGLGRTGAAIGTLQPATHITNCTFQNNIGPSGTIGNYANPGDVVLRNVLIDNNTGGNCTGYSNPALDADDSNMSDDPT
jgi:hypothetical protein